MYLFHFNNIYCTYSLPKNITWVLQNISIYVDFRDVTWVTVLLTCNLTWQKINDLRLVYVHFRFSLYLVLFFILSVSISRFQRDGEGVFFWLRILGPNDLNYMSGRFWREASWPLISSRGLSLVPNQSSLLWCLFFSYMLVLHNPENCFIFSASPERMTQTLYWKKKL